MKDDKWVMFKNYMHNELGIEKEDIRKWIKEAVEEQATQMINKTFEDFSIEDMTENIIKYTISSRYYSHLAFSDNIRNEVAKKLVDKIRLEVE